MASRKPGGTFLPGYGAKESKYLSRVYQTCRQSGVEAECLNQGFYSCEDTRTTAALIKETV